MLLHFDDATVREALIKGSYVSETDLGKAEAYAKQHRTSIVDFLMAESLLSKDILGQALAESLHSGYADLNSNKPKPELAQRIPAELAWKYRVVLFEEKEAAYIVTTDNPTQEGLLPELNTVLSGKEIIVRFSLSEDIDTILALYRKPLETRFSKIIEGQKRIAPELIDEIIGDALSYRASDVHFEPQGDLILVRFRVDGVLQEAGRLPKEQYESILNRIKVQSHLRIDEHFAAQDGSMEHRKGDTVVDLRTSIIPTIEGEKIVLRVLAAYIQGLSLVDIGLSQRYREILKKTAEKPFGMILVSGPTGSGKTTTLYSLLKVLNNPDINITTIEDPVEYKVRGINQIQVNAQTNLTFAKGLRSIVRQDPDIILVGEIRDSETSEIAINAALTGHLLLSTFHANDAATVVPRLLDMGAEPFLLTSTLQLIIAQRLARKICEQCRMSILAPSANTPQSAFFDTYIGKGVTLYKGRGCVACNQSGYKGRTALFEIIQMTPELQDLILKTPSAREIWKVARQQGAKSLFEDGIEKVKNGLTTIDELLRVAEAPQL